MKSKDYENTLLDYYLSTTEENFVLKSSLADIQLSKPPASQIFESCWQTSWLTDTNKFTKHKRLPWHVMHHHRSKDLPFLHRKSGKLTFLLPRLCVTVCHLLQHHQPAGRPSTEALFRLSIIGIAGVLASRRCPLFLGPRFLTLVVYA